MNYVQKQILRTGYILFVFLAFVIGEMFTMTDQPLAMMKGDGQDIKDEMGKVIEQQERFAGMLEENPFFENVPDLVKTRIKNNIGRAKNQVNRVETDDLDVPSKSSRKRPKTPPGQSDSDTTLTADQDEEMGPDLDLGEEIVDSLTDLEQAFDEFNNEVEDLPSQPTSATFQLDTAEINSAATKTLDRVENPDYALATVRPRSRGVAAAYALMSAAGMLAFVVVVLAIWALLRRLPFTWPQVVKLAPAYTIGSLSAFWFFERSWTAVSLAGWFS